MDKPRLLDLFAGAGGAARGYQRAGFYVIGVDHKPQPRYAGDEFIQADALELMEAFLDRGPWPNNEIVDSLEIIDVIHASPPCQFATALKSMPNAREHLNLIPQTRELLQATGLPYVIENVELARPWLREPFKLCGSSFGLGVRRHRLFETNWPIGMLPPCAHYLQPEPIDVTGTGGPAAREPGGNGGIHRKPRNLEHAREAMGIDWMRRPELSEAIPPAYTEFIGAQLMQHIRAQETTDEQEADFRARFGYAVNDPRHASEKTRSGEVTCGPGK